MGNRRASVVAASALCLIVAFTFAGCSSSGSKGDGETTTTPSIVERPGFNTPIAEGLEVQPGSHLLGTDFPAPHSTDSGARVALIAVDDDPVQVIGFYEQALTELGYQLGSTSCGEADPDGSAPQTCEVPASTDSTSTGAAGLWIAGPGDGRSDFATTIQLLISPRRPTTPSTGGSSLPRVPGTIITAKQAMKANPVRAVPSVPTPGVGDPVAAQSIDGDTELKVVEGSELLAPAVPLNHGRAGWSAVAKVTGDPVEVANAYLDQREWDDTDPAGPTGTTGSMITASAYVVGGPYVDLTLVPAEPAEPGEPAEPAEPDSTTGSESGDGPWWMLFTVTFD